MEVPAGQVWFIPRRVGASQSSAQPSAALEMGTGFGVEEAGGKDTAAPSLSSSCVTPTSCLCRHAASHCM
jgi:hypothetical protein